MPEGRENRLGRGRRKAGKTGWDAGAGRKEKSGVAADAGWQENRLAAVPEWRRVWKD